MYLDQYNAMKEKLAQNTSSDQFLAIIQKRLINTLLFSRLATFCKISIKNGELSTLQTSTFNIVDHIFFTIKINCIVKNLSLLEDHLVPHDKIHEQLVHTSTLQPIDRKLLSLLLYELYK